MDNLVPGLFSFQGRMGRAEFWLLSIALSFVSGGLLLAISMIVLAFAGGENAENLAPLHALGRGVLQLITIWPSLAIMTKRGHDRNYPAAMSIGLWVGSMVAFLVSAFLPLLSIVGLLIWIYIIVDYGFIPGTKGSNRYDVTRPGRSSAARQEAARLFE